MLPAETVPTRPRSWSVVVWGQELESNAPAEARVFGPINHSHATAAQLFHDSVVRDGSANHQEDAWLPDRFILRTRHLRVNECGCEVRV